MRITRMVFGDHSLHLSQDQDVSKLKAAVVRAVRSGGGLVDVLTVGVAEPVSVLVTVGIPVFFESRDTPDQDDNDPDTEDRMFLNHDDWDIHP